MENNIDVIPFGRYLIKVQDDITSMKGSILLPETNSKEKGNIAVVVKTPYNESNPIVQVGTRIMFSKYSGTVIKERFSDDEYRLVREEDILGFFK